jgi:flagellar motor switch/type III secretory pathway protein FliN
MTDVHEETCAKWIDQVSSHCRSESTEIGQMIAGLVRLGIGEAEVLGAEAAGGDAGIDEVAEVHGPLVTAPGGDDAIEFHGPCRLAESGWTPPLGATLGIGIESGETRLLWLLSDCPGLFSGSSGDPNHRRQQDLERITAGLARLVVSGASGGAVEAGSVAEPVPPPRTWVGLVQEPAELLGRVVPAGDAQVATWRATAGSDQWTASLVYPIESPAAVADHCPLDSGVREGESACLPEVVGTVSGVKQLPRYARSLLRIHVPLRVVLASKRQPIGQVVELCPGAIIGFDKMCDESLDLMADGRRIATGEAVKVGDKFGLRILSICLPEERYRKVVG